MSELRKGRMKMKFDYASLDCKPGVIAVAPPWTLSFKGMSFRKKLI